MCPLSVSCAWHMEFWRFAQELLHMAAQLRPITTITIDPLLSTIAIARHAPGTRHWLLCLIDSR
eukprot:scaffold31903_cov104-Isochrysis_galbana.AAC.5